MMCERYPRLFLAVAILALSFAATAAAQSNSKEILSQEPAKLIAILQNPKAPVFEKAKACQRLAVVGTKDAIPALVALLPDETLNVYARFGLEGIPDAAVKEALRAAATKLSGRQRIGVINSLGQLKDQRAVELLKGYLGENDPALVSAAAGALGAIGTTDAAKVLHASLAKDSPAQSAIADACLVCAERLASTGKNTEALALYQTIAKTSLPKHLIVGAIEGQFRILKGEAKELLLAQIRSSDAAFFELGLAAAREVPGQEVTSLLTNELAQGKLPAERQALLLKAVGDRRDPAVLPIVRTAIKSESPAVQEAAIAVLSKLGDASAAEVLLEAALTQNGVAEAAKEGLKNLAGPQVDKIISAKLPGAKGKSKVVLFEVAAARRIADAMPAVQESLSDRDEAVRLAAVAALGQLADLPDLKLLITRALSNTESKETAAAQSALTTAALRMADREACAAMLATYIQAASAVNQSYILDLLGKISGRKALEAVVSSARSNDPALKEAGTKVLGEWVNPDAANALLEIAKGDAQAKYQIRALRGYIRIARQLQLPDDERLAMFRTAMEIAKRDEDKQIALDILSRIPSPTTLQLAVSYLDQSGLKDASADAAVKIAGKVIDQQPKVVAESMQKVVAAGIAGDNASRAKQLLERAKAGSK